MNPTDLAYDLKKELSRCAEAAAGMSLYDLLTRAEVHLGTARNHSDCAGASGLGVAETIVDRIRRVICEWQDMPEDARAWLKGAMLYFVSTHDGFDDFVSPSGFDDDLHVMNACLVAAGRDDLKIRI